MKNPNGYGSVVKLSGKRRRPYAVRKTVGYDDRAYPIYNVIGYYETRKEAMYALAEYNHDPYDVDLAKLTFEDLYEKWSETELPKLGKSLAAAHRTSYKHCADLYKIPYKDLRKYNFQDCIDSCTKGWSTKNNIKNFLSTLDLYAYDQGVTRKQYTIGLKVNEERQVKEKTVFTDEEVQTLLAHIGEPYIAEALFLLYTGCRVTELLTVRCENIDLKEETMRCGIKTAAGINRLIPIHPRLLPIIKAHMKDSGPLFDYPLDPDNKDPEHARLVLFSRKWSDALTELGIHHSTHECRHTVRTKLDAAGANAVCIDRIIGHVSRGTGERVYTHKTVEDLRKTILLLSYENV